MIILSVLLIVMLIAISAIVVRLVFKPQWAWLNRIIYTMLALTLIFGVLATVAHGVCNNRFEALEAEAAYINLYYNTVFFSDNEYVRFDFYQRVLDYNATYEQLEKDANSAWIGIFFPADWNTRVTSIDFTLNSGVNG